MCRSANSSITWVLPNIHKIFTEKPQISLDFSHKVGYTVAVSTLLLRVLTAL